MGRFGSLVIRQNATKSIAAPDPYIDMVGGSGGNFSVQAIGFSGDRYVWVPKKRIKSFIEHATISLNTRRIEKIVVLFTLEDIILHKSIEECQYFGKFRLI